MGQALYRSYRSKKLSEIVGQEHITTALAHALENGTISHAYLFTGPRGTGKTSIARILAHEINNLPYEDGGRPHLDIIEIDAASNRRIDEIRDLRDKVHIAPSSAKYKVYIIDEVHMLTKEAFNALLKTLEEPPAHVVFMLATTEVHKLPETIISRVQRYALKPVDLAKVTAHLRHIADSEKISIDDDALALIAAHGEGSFRDSISLLDQIRNHAGTVTLADVQATLGIAPEEVIASLLTSLSTHNTLAIAEALGSMHDHGYEPAQVARQLGAALRQGLLAGTSQIPHDTALNLLQNLVQIPASANPRLSLEIALLDAALAGVPSAVAEQQSSNPSVAGSSSVSPAKKSETAKPTGSNPSSPVKEQPKAAPTVTKAMVVDAPAKRAIKAALKAEPVESVAQPVADTEAGVPVALTDNVWHSVLQAIKQRYNTLFSVVNAAQPHFEPGRVTLESSYAFHQKRLNEVKNKEILMTIIRSITGEDVQIVCIVGKGRAKNPQEIAGALPPADGEVVWNADATPTSITQRPTDNGDNSQPHASQDSLGAISDIFGGAELLES